jgi:hypothetical protein
MMQQPPPQGAQPMPGPPQQGPPQQPPVTIDAVMGLLRDGAMRRFRIDIEVDSTITGDESQERADRTAFIESTTKFVEAWGPIVAANPNMAQLSGELLLFGVRAFRVGRALEEVIEETVDKLEQQASQPKPPPPIPPIEQAKLQGVQMKTQAEGVKAQAGIQASQTKAKAETDKAQLEMFHAKIQNENTLQLAREKATMDKEAMMLDAEIKSRADQRAHELHQTKLQHEREAHAHKMQQADQQHQQTLQKGHQDMTAAAESHKQQVEQTKTAGDIQEKAAKAKPEAKPEPKAEPKQDSNPVKDVVSVLEALGKSNKPKKVIRDDSGKITGIE